MSPFDGEGVWLKCALHAHTTESDGDVSPAELAAAYRSAGYDVLAVTDHWRLTVAPETPGLLTVPASELSCDLGAVDRVADVLVYGVRELPDDPGGDRRNWIVDEEEHWEQRTFADLAAAARFAREHGGVAFVAHPYWTGLDAAPFLGCDEPVGLEVYNAGCEHESGRGDSSTIWDAALETGRTVFGIAADDAHVAASDIGHAWTWVRAMERSPEAVVGSLRSGRFYASTGPELLSLAWDGAELEVACTPCRQLVLQLEREHGSSVLARGADRQAHGRILERDADGLITRAVLAQPWVATVYVRLRAVDAAGRSAWTNPL